MEILIQKIESTFPWVILWFNLIVGFQYITQTNNESYERT